ncbi:MAG TPA: XdhC/CoxI family protein [Candidatus Binatia bacterium]|nr:XdhC/CoxI family protein [Candidatus Binatia bacterium]
MFDPRRLAEIAAGPHPAAVCTVVATRGSTPRKAGATMVVVADGSELGAIEGTIGGGAVENQVRRVALEVAATTQPRSFTIELTKELAMCCGGAMTFFVEALRVRPPLIVFGAGHVAQALCRVAATAGFDVHVADPREELLDAERFPDAVALVDDYEREDLARLPFGPDAFVVIATHDHAVDQQIVERVLPRAWRFCALLGSRRKAMMTRERCLAKGVAEDAVARLRCPAGLDIGAETPEEIAISVVAELVQVRRRAEVEARRTRGIPVRSVS